MVDKALIQEDEKTDDLPSEDIFVDTSLDNKEIVKETFKIRLTSGSQNGRIGVFDKKTKEFIRFEDTQEPIGQLEAAGRGAVSGLTSRFAPLLSGAFQGTKQQIGDVIDLFKSGVRPSEFTEEQRDKLSQFLSQRAQEGFETGTTESTKRFRQAREQFPVTSGITELGGGIAQALAIPGLGAPTAVGAGVTRTVGSRVLGGATRLGLEAAESAVFGGIAGLGEQSEALSRGEIKESLGAAKEVAKTSAILGPVLSRGLVPLAKGIGSTVGAIKNALADISPAAVSFFRKNSDLVENAIPSGQLSEDFASEFTKLSDEVLEQSQLVRGALSDEPKFNKSVIENVFDRLIKETDTEGQKAAHQKLIAFKQDLGKRFKDLLSEQDLKSIIDDLNTFAFSGSTILTDNITKNSIRRASREANTILKEANPQFAKDISPVERKLNALDNFEKKFALKAEPGGKIEAQDATVQKIRKTLDPDNVATTRAADQLDDAFGTDLGQRARATATAEDFRIIERPVKKGIQAGGLLRELTTAVAGKTIIGAEKLLGPTLGFIDKNLGKFGVFKKPLESAARRGPQALASTFFVMSSNPDFQKILKDIEKEKEDSQ